MTISFSLPSFTHTHTHTHIHTHTERPYFLEKPRDQLVSSGQRVTFNCSILSSPERSSLQWLQNGQLIDPTSGIRYIITSSSQQNTNQEQGGVVSTSSLTIGDVDGYNSGSVECLVTYLSGETDVMVSAEAVLSVLGESPG